MIRQDKITKSFIRMMKDYNIYHKFKYNLINKKNYSSIFLTKNGSLIDYLNYPYLIYDDIPNNKFVNEYNEIIINDVKSFLENEIKLLFNRIYEITNKKYIQKYKKTEEIILLNIKNNINVYNIQNIKQIFYDFNEDILTYGISNVITKDAENYVKNRIKDILLSKHFSYFLKIKK